MAGPKKGTVKIIKKSKYVEPEPEPEPDAMPLHELIAASQWLPYRDLELTFHGKSSRLLGGHVRDSNAIYVTCKCDDHEGHKHNRSPIFTLDGLRYEHILHEEMGDDDEEINDVCFNDIKVAPGQDCPYAGQSLYDFCRSFISDLGGGQLAGSFLWVYWWAEPHSPTNRAHEKKGTVKQWQWPKGSAQAKEARKSGFTEPVGIWFKAELVDVDEDKGCVHVVYISDNSEADLLLPLTHVHWGDEPPSGPDDVMAFPEGYVPPPAAPPSGPDDEEEEEEEGEGSGRGGGDARGSGAGGSGGGDGGAAKRRKVDAPAASGSKGSSKGGAPSAGAGAAGSHSGCTTQAGDAWVDTYMLSTMPSSLLAPATDVVAAGPLSPLRIPDGPAAPASEPPTPSGVIGGALSSGGQPSSSVPLGGLHSDALIGADDDPFRELFPDLAHGLGGDGLAGGLGLGPVSPGVSPAGSPRAAHAHKPGMAAHPFAAPPAAAAAAPAGTAAAAGAGAKQPQSDAKAATTAAAGGGAAPAKRAAGPNGAEELPQAKKAKLPDAAPRPVKPALTPSAAAAGAAAASAAQEASKERAKDKQAQQLQQQQRPQKPQQQQPAPAAAAAMERQPSAERQQQQAKGKAAPPASEHQGSKAVGGMKSGAGSTKSAATGASGKTARSSKVSMVSDLDAFDDLGHDDDAGPAAAAPPPPPPPPPSAAAAAAVAASKPPAGQQQRPPPLKVPQPHQRPGLKRLTPDAGSNKPVSSVAAAATAPAAALAAAAAAAAKAGQVEQLQQQQQQRKPAVPKPLPQHPGAGGAATASTAATAAAPAAKKGGKPASAAELLAAREARLQRSRDAAAGTAAAAVQQAADVVSVLLQRHAGRFTDIEVELLCVPASSGGCGNAPALAEQPQVLHVCPAYGGGSSMPLQPSGGVPAALEGALSRAAALLAEAWAAAPQQPAATAACSASSKVRTSRCRASPLHVLQGRTVVARALLQRTPTEAAASAVSPAPAAPATAAPYTWVLQVSLLASAAGADAAAGGCPPTLERLFPVKTSSRFECDAFSNGPWSVQLFTAAAAGDSQEQQQQQQPSRGHLRVCCSLADVDAEAGSAAVPPGVKAAAGIASGGSSSMASSVLQMGLLAAELLGSCCNDMVVTAGGADVAKRLRECTAACSSLMALEARRAAGASGGMPRRQQQAVGVGA